MTNIYDSIIIGSGPAGLTAAIYNVRADLKTLVIAGSQPGGQLTVTTTVENFPGFPDSTGGVKLMMDMMQQAKNLGTEIKYGLVKNIIKDEKLFKITLDNNEEIISKTVIVATGAQAKWLEIEKEMELMGKGVSGCATCDGAFFRGLTTCVIGGGNTACEDAIFLSKFCEKVYLIHRRDSLRATEVEQKRVFDNPKIEMVWNSEVKEIIGNDKLESIKIANKEGEERIIKTDGLFVAIGRTPATSFVKELLELKEGGQIQTRRCEEYSTMTSVPGIFAAGDCVDEIYRQAVIAAGEGAKAAIDTDKWLESNQ